MALSASTFCPDGLAPLLARGISAATLAAFDVTAGDDGYWWYPIFRRGYRVGWRGKRMTPGEPKYRWRAAQEGAAQALYAAGCVIPGRTALLCEGEPDAWLMHTAGLPACSFLGGAGTIPRPAVQELAQRPPSRVLVVYDYDDAGRAGAPLVVRALRDAGLAADALELPSIVGEHGDVSDLWRLVGHDRGRFVDALAACRRLAVPPPVPARTPRILRFDRATRRQDFNAQHDLVALVEQITPLQQHGAVWVGCCPLPGHDDHTPSFHVYDRDGRQSWFCFGCHQSGDAWWLNRQLGLAAS